MRHFVFILSALAMATPLSAESPPQAAIPAGVSTPSSQKDCLADCEAVSIDCDVQCRETTARAKDEHFDIPDVPIGKCLHACQIDLTICKQSCGN